MKRLLITVFSVAFAVGTFTPLQAATERETLSLDGTWRFAADPAGVGEAEQWFAPGKQLPKMPLEGYAKTADGTIRVPGCWDAQGYGTETDKVKHNFIGKGWYKKTVQVPKNWKSEKIFLSITGMSRYAKVWINGISVGTEAVGCVSIHEWDVTPLVKPGKEIDVTICVDSKQRYEIDTLFGAAQLADYMDIVWGGIWGHVRLEARPATRLDDLLIRTKIDGTCSARLAVLKETETTDCDTLTFEVIDASNRKSVAKTTVALTGDRKIAAERTPLTIDVKVPNPKLWSPESTNLYYAKLSLLKGNQVVDTVQTRFGIREFRIDGSDLLLNGKKLMLTGYGDDHIYPQEWSLSADKEMYLKRLRIVRSYGFNFVRHHSTTMPPEYYEACDETGVIPMVEFLIVYQPFMPGESFWLSQVPQGTSIEPAIKTYLNRFEAVVKQYRNHPSILCWIMGNELGGPLPQFAQLRRDFQRIAKEHDPDRFFLDTDGGDWKGYFDDPKNDRDTLDFVSYQFDEWTSPILNPAKFTLPKQRKPTLSHEAGNYITFTRPNEIDLYKTSNFKPFWMINGKVKLEELGLLGEANDWAAASDKLYLLHHKYNVESLRKEPTLSGYNWWLFQDYWTTSNGLVDTNFRPKSIKPEDVLPFNRPVVLLQDGLARTCRSGETLKASLLLSNYSPGKLSGNVTWKLTAENRTITEKTLPVEAEQGTIIRFGEAETVLPSTDTPKPMTLSVELNANGKKYENSWTAWLFPEKIVPQTGKTIIYTDGVNKQKCPEAEGWNFELIPTEGDGSKKLSADAVYIVSWLTESIADAMDRGASVVLLDGSSIIPSVGIRYQSSWWKGGDSEDSNHVGTFMYASPIVKEIAPDHWGNIAWANLLEGADKYNLEETPAKPEVIVRALPSIVRVQNTAVVYKVGIGKGTLIVSGLNHSGSKDRPENAWILKRMIEDAARFESPSAKWSVTFCVPQADVPEGMTLGFRRVVSEKPAGDTWYSYRRNSERVFICRQDQKGNFLEWETDGADGSNDTVTFLFAGGLGFATEPKTEGFELTFDGKTVLKFDLPDPTEWKSEDGTIVLKLYVKKTIGPDTFGLFTLTVPKASAESGTHKIGVRSLGQGSRRWFGLNPIIDLKKDFEK